MNVAVIDTLETARELEAAGVGHSEAEAITRVVATSAAVSREDLATKADLAAAVNKMLLSQIAVAGTLFAAIALLLAVLKFF